MHSENQPSLTNCATWSKTAQNCASFSQFVSVSDLASHPGNPLRMFQGTLGPKILHPRWPYAHLPQEVTESVLPLFQVFRRKPQELQGHSIAQLVQYRPEQLETSNIHSCSARFLSLGLPYHWPQAVPQPAGVWCAWRPCRKLLSSQLGGHHWDGRKSLLQHLRWTQAAGWTQNEQPLLSATADESWRNPLHESPLPHVTKGFLWNLGCPSPWGTRIV